MPASSAPPPVKHRPDSRTSSEIAAGSSATNSPTQAAIESTIGSIASWSASISIAAGIGNSLRDRPADSTRRFCRLVRFAVAGAGVVDPALGLRFGQAEVAQG